MIHQEPVINALSDRDSILPHVITSMGSPIPIKLKVASEIIAVLTFMTTINIMDEKKFGTRCFHKIRKNPAPVSYTHLDVYKRQEIKFAGNCCSNNSLFSNG